MNIDNCLVDLELNVCDSYGDLAVDLQRNLTHLTA